MNKNNQKNKNWWEIQAIKSKNLNDLTHVYNKKYGNYNYKKDARSIGNSFDEKFLQVLSKLKNIKNIIVTGANSGYEIELILRQFPEAKVFALDISSKALEILKERFPKVHIIHGDMENLNFNKDVFDLYVSCRAIHSSNINLDKALSEAIKVSRNILISIANGYVVEGNLVKGLYEYQTGRFDTVLPYKILEHIEKKLKEVDLRVSINECLSEIIITGCK